MSSTLSAQLVGQYHRRRRKSYEATFTSILAINQSVNK